VKTGLPAVLPGAYPVQVLNMMTKENALDVESIDAIIAATYDVISGPAGKRRIGTAKGHCFIRALG